MTRMSAGRSNVFFPFVKRVNVAVNSFLHHPELTFLFRVLCFYVLYYSQRNICSKILLSEKNSGLKSDKEEAHKDDSGL